MPNTLVWHTSEMRKQIHLVTEMSHGALWDVRFAHVGGMIHQWVQINVCPCKNFQNTCLRWISEFWGSPTDWSSVSTCREIQFPASQIRQYLLYLVLLLWCVFFFSPFLSLSFSSSFPCSLSALSADFKENSIKVCSTLSGPADLVGTPWNMTWGGKTWQ